MVGHRPSRRRPRGARIPGRAGRGAERLGRACLVRRTAQRGRRRHVASRRPHGRPGAPGQGGLPRFARRGRVGVGAPARA
jgi:hypothetical protein